MALSGFVYFSSSAVNGCQSHSINRQSPWQEKAWTNCGLVIPRATKSMSLWTHYPGKWTILVMHGCNDIATIQLRVAPIDRPWHPKFCEISDWPMLTWEAKLIHWSYLSTSYQPTVWKFVKIGDGPEICNRCRSLDLNGKQQVLKAK